MGFLDIFKKFFGKKVPPPSSPSEQGQVRVESADGQFATPQSPPAPNSPQSTQTGQPQNPVS